MFCFLLFFAFAGAPDEDRIESFLPEAPSRLTVSVVVRVRGGEHLRIFAGEREHRHGLVWVVVLRVRARVPRGAADDYELHRIRQPEFARVAQPRVVGSRA